MKKDVVHNMDCLEGLKLLLDNSIDCCVTSPPYFGLRDYGHQNQIGLEETPELFVNKMVEVFTEVRRVLKKEGTLWLNLGDSYCGGGFGRHVDNKAAKGVKGRSTNSVEDLKSKDLIGIPWMVAFALRSSGWYLRQDIIWHKPNPMPESVTDRCTKAHEYIFLLSKSANYYYDHNAIKQPIADASIARLAQDIESQKGSERVPGKMNGAMKAVGHKNLLRTDKTHSFHEARKGSGIDNTAAINGNGVRGHSGYFDAQGNLIGDGKANKRSVWTVTTKPFSEAHFATFPQDLIIDCIKAGCPEGGIVLDPFMGAFTTALVARKLNRHYVGFELNPEYITIGMKRLDRELGMFI